MLEEPEAIALAVMQAEAARDVEEASQGASWFDCFSDAFSCCGRRRPEPENEDARSQAAADGKAWKIVSGMFGQCGTSMLAEGLASLLDRAAYWSARGMTKEFLKESAPGLAAAGLGAAVAIAPAAKEGWESLNGFLDQKGLHEWPRLRWTCATVPVALLTAPLVVMACEAKGLQLIVTLLRVASRLHIGAPLREALLKLLSKVCTSVTLTDGAENSGKVTASAILRAAVGVSAELLVQHVCGAKVAALKDSKEFQWVQEFLWRDLGAVAGRTISAGGGTLAWEAGHFVPLSRGRGDALKVSEGKGWSQVERNWDSWDDGDEVCATYPHARAARQMLAMVYEGFSASADIAGHDHLGVSVGLGLGRALTESKRYLSKANHGAQESEMLWDYLKDRPLGRKDFECAQRLCTREASFTVHDIRYTVEVRGSLDPLPVARQDERRSGLEAAGPSGEASLMIKTDKGPWPQWLKGLARNQGGKYKEGVRGEPGSVNEGCVTNFMLAKYLVFLGIRVDVPLHGRGAQPLAPAGPRLRQDGVLELQRV